MLVVTLFVNFLSGNIFQIKYLQKAKKIIIIIIIIIIILFLLFKSSRFLGMYQIVGGH